MFVASETDKRRVTIIDVSHLFYRYAYSGMPPLSVTIKIDGVLTNVVTNLPAMIIKQIHRWSNFGFNPTVVCFDSAGCSKSRKAYFAKENGIRENAEPVGYKSSRGSQNDEFYKGMNLTQNLLINGGVCCLYAESYEADDLIKAAVDKAKVQYPNLPIDIFTGDQDLIPLVDDQVSVFIVSKKLTWAESPALEKRNYFQLRPYNYQTYVEELTEFKKLIVPYNTVLLKKLLRGKKADDIPAYPKFTPTKYNNLVNDLIEDGYDLEDLFIYDSPTRTICYRGTEEPIPLDLIDSTPRERKMIKFSEPPALTRMCEVLENYLDEDIIKHIRFIYNGVNLNGAFTGLPDGFNRRPATMTLDVKGYNAGVLAQAVSDLKINLPVG